MDETPRGALSPRARRGVVAGFGALIAISAAGVLMTRCAPTGDALSPTEPPVSASAPNAVTAPVQLTAGEFEYPEDLWDAQVEGTTTLRLFISAAGAVDTVRLETSSGYAGFDSVAVRGAPKLRFQPATQGGQPVGAWYLLPVEFDLGVAP